jgi:hypothetical protein
LRSSTVITLFIMEFVVLVNGNGRQTAADPVRAPLDGLNMLDVKEEGAPIINTYM